MVTKCSDPAVVDMAAFLVNELTNLGFSDIQLKDLGTQPPPVADANLQLPPIVLARFGNDASKKDRFGVWPLRRSACT